MNYLQIDSISKRFNSVTNKQVLENISFDVEEGSLVAIFGPNGCGKTTLFSIISGILEPDNGKISLKNKPVKNAKISFMFQNYSDTLMPWKTCLDNIAFPLELEGVDKEERQQTVKKFVKDLDIPIPLDQYPYQCSGGQKQLTAIARALIVKPDLFLLDEPFSALDYDTRIVMEEKLLEIWSKVKTTILVVSHDIDESLFLSDKVIVMSGLPSNVVDVIKVELSRPRNAKVIESEQFHKLRNNIVEAFHRGKKR